MVTPYVTLHFQEVCLIPSGILKTMGHNPKVGDKTLSLGHKIFSQASGKSMDKRFLGLSTVID